MTHTHTHIHTGSFSLAAETAYTEKLLTTKGFYKCWHVAPPTDLMVQREMCMCHTHTNTLSNQYAQWSPKERKTKKNQCCVFHRPLQANESHSLQQSATKTLYTTSKRFIPNHLLASFSLSSHHMQMIVLDTIEHSFRGQVHSSSSITAFFPRDLHINVNLIYSSALVCLAQVMESHHVQ